MDGIGSPGGVRYLGIEHNTISENSLLEYDE